MSKPFSESLMGPQNLLTHEHEVEEHKAALEREIMETLKVVDGLRALRDQCDRIAAAKSADSNALVLIANPEETLALLVARHGLSGTIYALANVCKTMPCTMPAAGPGVGAMELSRSWQWVAHELIMLSHGAKERGL